MRLVPVLCISFIIVPSVLTGCGGVSNGTATTTPRATARSTDATTTSPPPTQATYGLAPTPPGSSQHFSGVCLQVDYPAGWYVGASSHLHGVDLVVLQSFQPETYGHGGLPTGAIKVDISAQPARGGDSATPTQGDIVGSVWVEVDGIPRDLNISRVAQQGDFYEADLRLTKGEVALVASVLATTADDVAEGTKILPSLQVCDRYPAE